MKRRKQNVVLLMAVLLILSVLSWSAHRAILREQRNRRMIAAIKQTNDERSPAAEVRACLALGADPNARDEPYRRDLSWDRFLIWFGMRKAPASPAQSALLLALEGEIKVVGAPQYRANTEVVKALLHYGADVRGKISMAEPL